MMYSLVVLDNHWGIIETSSWALLDLFFFGVGTLKWLFIARLDQLHS